MKCFIRAVTAGLGLAAVLGIQSVASAQGTDSGAFPNRPIKVVVPWAPGGLTDILARALAQKMTESLGQSVIVENRPGASGSIGAGMVAKSAPDGYTLLIANTDTHALVPALRTKPPYDPSEDFAPVSRIGSQALLLTVNSTVQVKSASELVALAKSKPNQVSYASWGNGTVSHLGAEMFSGPAGIQMVHVPYKGVNPAVIDVVAGRVDAIFISIASAGDNLPSGKLRPLAISSRARSALLPEVPTVAELGYPGFEISLWYGLSAPRGTPADVVRKLNEAVRAAVTADDMKRRFAGMGLELAASTPAEFGEFVVVEGQRWAKAVRDAKVTIE